MTKLTRRGAFAALTGAATATMIGPALGATSHPREAPLTPAVPAPPRAHPDARTAWARVASCRSWDRRIYLHVSDEIRGFALVDEAGLALAAAAQLAGRQIAVHYWGHTPDESGGGFAGVLLACDLRDLPVTT